MFLFPLSVFDELHKINLQTHYRGFPIYDILDDMGENNIPVGAIVEYALAGYKKENLVVDVNHNKIQVHTKTDKVCNSSDEENAVLGYNPQNRIARRSFCHTLVDQHNRFDLEKIEASFVDGILRLRIPYRAAEIPKSISIQ